VVSAQRICREVDTPFKRVSARSFYWLMQKMVDQRLKRDVGDYRLLSKRAVEAVREFREQHRFMRGLIAWLGLREAIVPFQREHRAAGCTKYSLLKMLRFSWTAITSFSALPLRLALGLGTVMACVGFLIFVWACYSALVLHATVPGWTSLVAVQSVFSGITLFCVGLMGDFVGRIYEEAKGRPLYVVTEVDNGSARPAWRERTVVIAAEMNSKMCDKDLEFGRKPLHGIPSLEAQPDPEREVCNGIRV